MHKKILSTAIMSKSFLLAALMGGVFVMLTEPAIAQGGPPPGGGGGNSPVKLDDLGCGPNEIARVNAADEWECSASLTADEGDIATLQTALATLTTQIGALQAQVDGIAARLATAETAIADLAAAQSDIGALADYVDSLATHVSVIDRFRDIDGDGVDDPVPTVVFEGANVQIVNGVGVTSSINGRGNLIIGYDKERTGPLLEEGLDTCSYGGFSNAADCVNGGHTWAHNHKSGSHNLIVGSANNYSRFGGVVFGELNTVNGNAASVTGGYKNISSGYASSIGAGYLNMAQGPFASVSGGGRNLASGLGASVSGGRSHVASGDVSSVSGGRSNVASGNDSSVSGGGWRTADGNYDWVAGSLFEEQ